MKKNFVLEFDSDARKPKSLYSEIEKFLPEFLKFNLNEQLNRLPVHYYCKSNINVFITSDYQKYIQKAKQNNDFAPTHYYECGGYIKDNEDTVFLKAFEKEKINYILIAILVHSTDILSIQY
ncbi:MAG: hypothetical protein WC123_05365 [Bacilli bacterium]